MLSDVDHEMGSPDAARARQGRRRGPPAGAAGRAAALVRRGLPARAPRVADRHRPGRPDVPRRGRTAGSRSRSSGSARIDAVEQLTRYLERIRLDPAFADCRGVLAAQVIKPQARVLAEARGISLGRGRAGGAARRARAGADTVRLDERDAVLTERRDGVLVITINRPEARNAVNGAVAEGDRRGARPARRRRRAARRHPHRRRQGVLRRHGPEGVRRPASGRRSATAGSPASRSGPPEKPLIAAIEGFARGRRARGRARLRPDRRVARRQARHPRGQARRWSPRAAGCCACRSGCRTTSRWSWR